MPRIATTAACVFMCVVKARLPLKFSNTKRTHVVVVSDDDDADDFVKKFGTRNKEAHRVRVIVVEQAAAVPRAAGNYVPPHTHGYIIKRIHKIACSRNIFEIVTSAASYSQATT